MILPTLTKNRFRPSFHLSIYREVGAAKLHGGLAHRRWAGAETDRRSCWQQLFLSLNLLKTVLTFYHYKGIRIEKCAQIIDLRPSTRPITG